MSRFRRFFSRWQNWIGLSLILIYVGVALFAPYLSPDNPKEPGAFVHVAKGRWGSRGLPAKKSYLARCLLESMFIMR